MSKRYRRHKTSYDGEKLESLVDLTMQVNGYTADLPPGLTNHQLRSAIMHVIDHDSGGSSTAFKKAQLQALLEYFGKHVDGSRGNAELRCAIADEAGFDYQIGGTQAFRKAELAELLKAAVRTDGSSIQTTGASGRSSTSSSLIPPTMTVVTFGIALAVASKVYSKLQTKAAAAELEQISETCNGFFGCNGIQLHDVTPFAAVVVLVIGISVVRHLVNIVPEREYDDWLAITHYAHLDDAEAGGDCVVCGQSTTDGVTVHYGRALIVFGWPLTLDDGRNHYCNSHRGQATTTQEAEQ